MPYTAHILVVDDEPDICWALENILKREDYHVTLVMNGKEALKLAKDRNFKIAFIDVKLLDMDGIELCRLLREVAPDTTRVVISGYLYRDDDVVQQGLKEGVFAEFISKPFNLDEISQVVEKVL
jgi:DNA-binding NtrC family response regulator